MLFGGLQRSSLIDYPGKLSCVIFLSGCNFRCPYCHNPELVRSRPVNAPLDWGAIQRFLERRRGVLDAVVVSGGEPTLLRELVDLCSTLKRMGFAVKVDTNGSRPGMVKSLLDKGVVDYFAVDIKTDPSGYAPPLTRDVRPEQLLETIQTVMAAAPAYEFRTTCVKPFIDPHSILMIAKTIKGAELFALQAFRGERVLDPAFFRGGNAGYDRQELQRFKSLVEPWVRKCIIR